MAKPIITAERLRELLHYDPLTGLFVWRVTRNRNAVAGDVAGYTNTQGYIVIKVDGECYYAHRLAWLYVAGAFPPCQIDHKDTIKSNNRLINLRQATGAQNAQNKRKAKDKKAGALLGAYAHQGRWMARIGLGGRAKYLGMFDTAELAHAAYLEAKAEIHPFQTLV